MDHPNGDPMRSVRMPAAFLPCSDGSPEWIPHGGLLLQRPPAACTHLVPNLARTKPGSDEVFETCKAYLQTTPSFMADRWHSMYKPKISIKTFKFDGCRGRTFIVSAEDPVHSRAVRARRLAGG